MVVHVILTSVRLWLDLMVYVTLNRILVLADPDTLAGSAVAFRKLSLVATQGLR